jgi:hypothetical protein
MFVIFAAVAKYKSLKTLLSPSIALELLLSGIAVGALLRR